MAVTPAIDAWTNAVKYVKNYGGSQTLNSLDLRAMNSANQMFHLAAPWSWSVGGLEEVTLENGTQDYPLATSPSDFLRLSQVRQFKNGKFTATMNIAGNLPTTIYSVSEPTQVSMYLNSTTLTYRVWPKPAGFLDGKPIVLIGDYKKKTTLITSGNKSTASILLFPDDYYYVYELLVLYYAYLYANDMRAGTTTLDAMGRPQYTGILALAMAEINILRQKELLSLTPEGGPIA